MEIKITNRPVENRNTAIEINFNIQAEENISVCQKSTSNFRTAKIIALTLLVCTVVIVSAFDGNFASYGHEVNWETIAIGSAWSIVCAFTVVACLKLSTAMINDIKHLRI